MDTIHTFTDGDIPVVLKQGEAGRFEVHYGAHDVCDLPYGRAAAEYGECVFHSLACASKLDNSEDDDDCTFKGA